jgi:hypothetical protein
MQRYDWQSASIVLLPLIGATVLSKLSVPPLGSHGIGLVFPLVFAALAFGLVTGRLQFASQRLLLFLVAVPVLGTIQLLHGEIFSLSSVALMAALGLAYVFTMRAGQIDAAQSLAYFRNLTAAVALLGIAQFVVQFAVGMPMAFPIESYVPAAFRTQAFNNIVPLYWGSSIYKANGVVMLEPSVFSQLCALGLIAELSGAARILRLALFAGALVVSYSGTGLLILAVSLPLFVVMHRRWDLLLQGLLLVLILAVLAEPLNITALLDRTSEFSSRGSSGFARFVAWQDLFADRLWTSTFHALFGFGAGSFVSASAGYAAAEMSYSKIIFEFGVLGGLLYFAFVFYCLLSAPAPLILRIAVCVCYFMNGAYSPSMTGIALSLLLWPAQREEERAPAAMEAQPHAA